MRAINLMILIGLVGLAASCEPEVTSFPLTEADKQMIPYKLGQTVRFIDSEGQPFTLTVTEDLTDWTIFEEVISENFRTVDLQSDNSDFHIRLNVDGWNYGNKNRRSLYMVMLPSGYIFYVNYDSAGKFLTEAINKQYFYDSLQIDNNIYYDVVVDNNWDDPMQLFYNRTYGILQIKKEGENFLTINP